MKFILLLLISLNSWAGGGIIIDGGGGGVTIQGKTYLMDFYEMGIHQKAFVGSHGSDQSLKALRGLKSDLNLVSDETLRMVSGKIDDIEKRDPVFASFVQESLLNLVWNFSPQEISETADLFFCTLKQKPEQLANRQGNIVVVDLEKFKKMDSANQAGLILHEAIQALLPENFKDVCHHRRVVAQLFTEAFFGSDSQFWNQTLKNYPTSVEAIKKYPAISGLHSKEGVFSYTRFILLSSSWPGPDLENGEVRPLQSSNWYLFLNLNIRFENGLLIKGLNLLDSPSGKSLCAADANPVQNMEIKYWRAVLSPRVNENGQTLPRFDWGLRETLFDYYERTGLSQPKTACDSHGNQFMDEFDLWKTTARYFRADSN